MQLFYELFPVILFVLAFKLYDIYMATTVGIIATFVQVIATRLWVGVWDKKQVITCVVFTVFGSMTLYFHDPIFIKWKPTIVFWIFSIILLIYQFFTSKPLMQRVMEKVLEGKGEVPAPVWQRLNFLWAAFFIVLGAVNLYVAYHFSSDAWVNFKLYGVTSALFLFSIVQTFYLFRYLSHDKAP